MRHLMLTLVFVATLAWGCVPSDQTAPQAEPTPTAATGNEITGMDFESGEVEQESATTVEPAEEPTPEEPALEPTPDIP